VYRVIGLTDTVSAASHNLPKPNKPSIGESSQSTRNRRIVELAEMSADLLRKSKSLRDESARLIRRVDKRNGK
jgi:hypothetical protein